MTPSLLVTVDSELSNFPYGQGLWGKVGDESWGLARLIKVFDELEISATFFLDVYGGDDEQVKHQRMARRSFRAFLSRWRRRLLD